MGIRSLSTASISTGTKRSKVWDQSAVVVTNSYESIATVNVTSTTSSITFSSIPSTYTHLQIRATVIPAGGDNMLIRLNGDTGTNYSSHQIQGDGTSVTANADSTSDMYLMGLFQAGSYPFVGIWDILDYKDTNKYKTVRGLVGTNNNSSSTAYRVGFSSGNWRNTAAVNTITMLSKYSSGFSQYSQFALYGIKG